jgi:hypothetical protein
MKPLDLFGQRTTHKSLNFRNGKADGIPLAFFMIRLFRGGCLDKQSVPRRYAKCFAPDCICQSSSLIYPNERDAATHLQAETLRPSLFSEERSPEDGANDLDFRDRDDNGTVESHHDLMVLVVSALGCCAGALEEPPLAS